MVKYFLNVFLAKPGYEVETFLKTYHLFIYGGSRSETRGKFRNVVLEKDGEDQLDRSCEK
jgi:hypothetical protein